MISNENLRNAKLHISSSTSLVLIISLGRLKIFTNLKHNLGGQNYLKQKWGLNYKVVDILEIYNFDTKIILIQLRLKKL